MLVLLFCNKIFHCYECGPQLFFPPLDETHLHNHASVPPSKQFIYHCDICFINHCFVSFIYHCDVQISSKLNQETQKYQSFISNLPVSYLRHIILNILSHISYICFFIKLKPCVAIHFFCGICLLKCTGYIICNSAPRKA